MIALGAGGTALRKTGKSLLCRVQSEGERDEKGTFPEVGETRGQAAQVDPWRGHEGLGKS